jgi:hypothetical protein
MNFHALNVAGLAGESPPWFGFRNETSPYFEKDFFGFPSNLPPTL